MVAFTVVNGLLLREASASRTEQVIAGDRTIVNLVGLNFSDYVNGNIVSLFNIAQNQEIIELNATESPVVLGQAQLARPELGTVLLVNTRQQIVAPSAQTGENLGLDLGDQLNQTLLARTTVVSSPKTTAAGSRVIVTTVPIVAANNTVGPGQPNPAVDEDVVTVSPNSPQTSTDDPAMPGQVIGALASVMRIDVMQQDVIGGSGGNSEIAIIRDGQLVLGTDEVRSDPPGFIQDHSGPIAGSTTSGPAGFTNRGRDEAGAYGVVSIANQPWSVIVSTRIELEWWKAGVPSTVAIVLAVAIAGLIAVVVGELTARPLRRLAANASAVRQGDVTPIQPLGTGEIRTLSMAMANMATQIRSQFERLVDSRSEIGQQAERMRELLRRTLRLQEDERRRIASDIHDAVSPLITGALYQARALQRNVETIPAAERHDSLENINSLLERASEELHEVIFDLRPPDLDDIGVVAAIEAFTSTIQRTGLRCSLEVIDEPPPLTSEIRLGVYRIVQESLHNVIRHAQADEAIVRIETTGSLLRVSVRDNGTGFDPDEAVRPRSLGLMSMRERASAIGATLRVVSHPGSGTAVILERPIPGHIMSYDGQQPTGGSPVRPKLPVNNGTGAVKETGQGPATKRTGNSIPGAGEPWADGGNVW